MQENMENERNLNAGEVNTPQSWKMYILNLRAQPVDSKSNYFLFILWWIQRNFPVLV